MGAVLDQASLQISREREASQPRTPLLLLPELLRNALASLALALGFAALARRRAAISRCCRSCKAGCGAPSRAAPPAVPAPPMPVTSSSSAAGIGSPNDALMR